MTRRRKRKSASVAIRLGKETKAASEIGPYPERIRPWRKGKNNKRSSNKNTSTNAPKRTPQSRQSTISLTKSITWKRQRRRRKSKDNMKERKRRT